MTHRPVPDQPSPAPTLLVTVAHPDDESFGCGSVIAGCAARGWTVIVCSASRGEAGEDVSGGGRRGADLAAAREVELREASAILGSTEVVILDFADSGWDGDAPTGSLVHSPERLSSAVAELIAAHRPDVVVTMDPTGSDGHRDHAAIGAATTAAFAATVDWPASLYHWCLPHSLMDRWAREIAATDPDSVYLGTELGRADADVTTVVDGSAVREARRRSIEVHRTQAGPYRTISADLTDAFVTRDHLIRIVPPWTPGPRETELHVPAGGGVRRRPRTRPGRPSTTPPASPSTWRRHPRRRSRSTPVPRRRSGPPSSTPPSRTCRSSRTPPGTVRRSRSSADS